MANDAPGDRLQALGMFASALAGRARRSGCLLPIGCVPVRLSIGPPVVRWASSILALYRGAASKESDKYG